MWTILLLTDRNPYHDLALSTLEKFAKALEVDIRAIDRDKEIRKWMSSSEILKKAFEAEEDELQSWLDQYQ